MSVSSLDNQTEEWIAYLQAKGYRTSTPLRIVVEILASSHRVLSPLQIYDLVRGKNPKLGLVTIYRTVEKLEEVGLIQRVHQPSGCQAFVATNTGHQHLLICENCGRVEFFSGDKLESLISDVGSETGYKIASHWLQLFGICENCQQEKNLSTG
jgi:Fe2+ or Zn2+ uptake regulation protein